MPKGTQKPYTQQFKQQALDAMKQGMTLLQAHEKFGVSCSSLSKWRKMGGMASKSGSRYPRRAQVIASIRSGMSVREASIKHKITEGTIYKWLQDDVGKLKLRTSRAKPVAQPAWDATAPLLTVSLEHITPWVRTIVRDELKKIVAGLD